MIKMLIIADDITGALDTGVKFSKVGILTKVVVGTEIPLVEESEDVVIVLCAATRHLSPEDAYQIIYDITRQAAERGIPYILKKTDSALRGNVGAELSAVLDGSGECELCFIPAFPAMKRITVEGTHYIDGVPVHESVFGKDPFDPVTESYIPALLKSQATQDTEIVSCRDIPAKELDKKQILVFDSSTQSDIDSIIKALRATKRLHLLAGCAGLAESFAASFYTTVERKRSKKRITVVCGSLNPISSRQLDIAEQQGFNRIHIPEEYLLGREESDKDSGQKFMDALWARYRESPFIIIDTQQMESAQIQKEIEEITLEGVRQRISTQVGKLLKDLMDRGAESPFMIVGGDTLLAFLEAIGGPELYPEGELVPGVVFSTVEYQGKQYEIISKSGGFGNEDLLVKMANDS